VNDAQNDEWDQTPPIVTKRLQNVTSGKLAAESTSKGRLLRGKGQQSKIKRTMPHQSVPSGILSAEYTSEGRLLRGKGVATLHGPTQTSSGYSNNDYDVGWEGGQFGDWTEDNPNGEWGEGNNGEENGYYIGNQWHSSWSDPSKRE
jgi:hypothetical protein